MSGTAFTVSYVLLWLAVCGLGLSTIALLRQIGVLHTRVAPMGVHFAGEGPELDEPAPPLAGVDYAASPVTLVAFTSPTCTICETLAPSLRRIGRRYDEIDLRIVDHGVDPAAFDRFSVRSTPYVVAIDDGGIVRSRGVANTADQVEEMVAEVLAGPPIPAEGVVVEADGVVVDTTPGGVEWADATAPVEVGR